MTVQKVLESAALTANGGTATNDDGVNVNGLNGAMVIMKVTGGSTNVTFNWYTKPEKGGAFDDSPYQTFTLSNTDGQITRPMPGVAAIFELTCTATNNDTSNACTVDAGVVANYKWG